MGCAGEKAVAFLVYPDLTSPYPYPYLLRLRRTTPQHWRCTRRVVLAQYSLLHQRVHVGVLHTVVKCDAQVGRES